MRTSVITRFAKNDRAFSGRHRIATLAATVVLAGGVQLLTTDTAWAAGNGGTAAAGAPAATARQATADHHGSYKAGFHMTPDGQTIIAGGPKVEIGVAVTNFTGAPYQNVSAMLALFNPNSGTGLRIEDLTVEVASAGGWKPVKLRHYGDSTLFTVESPATTTPRLEDGRAANFMFRVGLSAKAPKDLTELGVGTIAKAPGFPADGTGDANHTFQVARSTAPGTKPTTPAKPKPTPTKDAKPAPAKPAAEQTKDTAPAAPAPKPTTPTTAPATTAPAGTPELAQTGSSSTNTFLAASSALLLALGAGVLIAVRRLRPQR
ncbi:LAETG motif-containing sortase-dependent surface protein [Streptomyces sp. CB02056]|uniref:LAETG motif-containing sortase-dependent surface protein n=1 Tax=Streptomyces sp. CB02056 TaxID=1703924 RepID=UPI00093B059C|nr:LAETG motif-containing sortase-dependent surface protein [Streptomyces sp. CB02056]